MQEHEARSQCEKHTLRPTPLKRLSTGFIVTDVSDSVERVLETQGGVPKEVVGVKFDVTVLGWGRGTATGAAYQHKHTRARC